MQTEVDKMKASVGDNIEIIKDVMRGETCSDCTISRVLESYGKENLQGIKIGLAIGATLGNGNVEVDLRIANWIAHCLDLEADVLESDFLEVKDGD